jgi:hypothetical protein
MRWVAHDMFKVFLVVCALRVQPSECSELTALHVLKGPDCKNEIVCAKMSQAYLASTELGRTLRENEYLKVRCERKSAPAFAADNQ